MAEIEYETRDVNVRTVARAGLALAMLAAVGAAVSFGVYQRLRQVHQRQDRPAAPLAEAPGRLPPIPRLQSAPQADLGQLRAQHLRELTSYGWINQQSGATRIHVEEAMRLYVQRMASRAPAAAGAPALVDVPREAAGPSGTATMPPAAPTPSPAAPPGPRPRP